MSANSVFIKVNKRDGFVRANNWKPLGIIGCRFFIDYLVETLELPTLEIGDSVCFLDDYKLSYVDIEDNSSFETYKETKAKRLCEILTGYCDEEINYRMTEDRIKKLYDNFDNWASSKSSDDIENMKSILNQLKEYISKVNFKRENMIFSYHY